MQSEELKPCPFCGCEKILDGYIRDGREIVCGECRASIAAFHPDASKRAAERWNRRAEAALSTDAEPVKIEPDKILAQVAAIICEETCGLTSQCKSREAAKALFDKGYLSYPPAPAVAVKALEWHERLKKGEREGFVCSSSGVLSYSIMLSHFRVYGIPGEYDGAAEFTSLDEAKAAAQADYEARIRSALSVQVQDVAGYGDSQLAIIHSAIEKAANAADAAVYEAMRSNDFDPAIPDNVAEFVGKAVRKAFDANAHAPSSNHVNGGAYRIISVDEWRSLGGDENKFCDWHEGIGYVIYDDIAKEQYRAKIAAAPAAQQGEAE